ncbi:MAG TPA: class II fructose-bisphosphatase [Oligoflexus sp.]|uniref:class II fructose-bisphosphatase n=1 Tax=Oligoflexus sp. TaxID=1971216 RepID=UPI002D80117D|nr:class II fructose-bisphosphatase [Oligoflexus sp.]HET9237308.1 class II fructose-bisphosphatase [Oligoflexus sp.]
MDRNLALEFVRVTEAAALSAARWVGRGDENAADHAAVESMRRAFDSMQIDATIVIGEGERDEAPMLYIGEKVGKGGPRIDIACDPLEGTSITAKGGSEALAVIAAAEHGNFLHAPDTYMKKLAVGPAARGVIDINETPTWNLQRIAKAMHKKVEDLTVIILDRPRHQELIGEVRQAGACIRLIGDGDVSAAIATADSGTGVDVLMGVGGAPEGVIAAAALRCLGGEIQGVLQFRKDDERVRARAMGITDENRVYGMDDLAKGNVMFIATGVTNGSYLRGVRYTPYGATTHSIVMRSQTGTIREITSRHHFATKPNYGW